MGDPRAKGKEDEPVSVTINGTVYKVPKTFSEVSLNDYLRSHLQLTGTKVMCREGGCGACVVNIAYKDPDPSGNGKVLQRAINSCLCPILSCDGCEVTTVEGIGNQKDPHPIQSRLTEHYGTQCGYCTPGMVMSMYSLLQSHPNGDLTKQKVEDSFGGNLCRCTGYRPILDAFKSFAVCDVEDAGKHICKKSGKPCSGTCDERQKPFSVVMPLHESVASNAPPWYKPTTLFELYKLIQTLPGNVYYVVGHTGKGVYNDAPYHSYVDLKGIDELYLTKKTDKSWVIGANVSLTDVIEMSNDISAKDPNFMHLKHLAAMVFKTAQPPVRNAGSWGGNFSMKNRHKDMPSDSFVAFTAMDAKIVIGQGGTEASLSCEDFLKLDMSGKIIIRAEFPPFPKDFVFRTFKVMIRSQNSHAYVIAAFRAKVNKSSANQAVVSELAIAYGNISPHFVRAKKTEAFLNGKNFADPSVLQQALTTLNEEIKPEEVPAEASPKYKRSLSVSLFYKFALEVVGEAAHPRYRSAVGVLQRPLSTGVQSYPTKEANYPLTQPIPKIESMVQCTGEAKYVSDVEQDGMLHAAFAITTEGNTTGFKLDTRDAMKLPGVIQVITAADIPGKNNISTPNSLMPAVPEELLASENNSYAGQPVAIVVAVTRDVAEEGAKLVKITYSGVQQAIATTEDAIAKQSFFDKPPDLVVGDAVGALAGAFRKVSGEMSMGAQIHFYMENQVAVSFPTEDGLHVEAGTQWLDSAQAACAEVTGIPKNRVTVSVKRNGGGFGGKIFRSNPICAATSVAAYLLKRPVKMHMSLWDNSKVIGKRFPYYFKYEVGFDEKGKIHGIVFDIYSSVGGEPGGGMLFFVPVFIDNGYKIPNWKISMTPCKTNVAINTACRSPGSTEFIYMIEHIMEHVAHSLNKSAIDVKIANFYKDGDVLLDGSTMSLCTISPITTQLLDSSSYLGRLKEAEQFNQANRWRKKGLAVVPMRFPAHWTGMTYGCLLTVYHASGTVAITHGGVEIGQGLNTKVAQVVAYELGIDISQIVIQTSTTMTSANAAPTGGSVASELVCMAATDCCAQIKKRLEKAAAALPSTATWGEKVDAAYQKQADLTAWAWANPNAEVTNHHAKYQTYGAMCTEVELDILTGEYQISRLDTLYDCGESLSPLVDVGQAEGSIIMGLGYYTSEEVIFDRNTGENLTYSTWTYKPPTTKDIPIDFRVELLQNSPNPSGFLRSKIVGEPPLCMAASVVFALRNAIKSHLAETGKGKTFFRMDVPVTPARAQECCMLDLSQLRYSP